MLQVAVALKCYSNIMHPHNIAKLNRTNVYVYDPRNGPMFKKPLKQQPQAPGITVNFFMCKHTSSTKSKSRSKSPMPKQQRSLTTEIARLSRNPQLVSSYYKEIVSYTLQREKSNQARYTVNERLMRVDLEARAVRMGLLVTLCEGMEVSKSLFMAAYFWDKIMEMVGMKRELPGLEDRAMIAAMFTATKLSEIYPPQLNDFLEVTEVKVQSKAQILTLQSQLLGYLQYDTNRSNQQYFLELFSQILDLSSSQLSDCLSILQYSLIAPYLFKVRPSLKAAAVIYLLNSSLEMTAQQSERIVLITYLTKYTVKELKKTAEVMMRSLRFCFDRKVTCVRDKYVERQLKHLPWLGKVQI